MEQTKVGQDPCAVRRSQWVITVAKDERVVVFWSAAARNYDVRKLPMKQ